MPVARSNPRRTLLISLVALVFAVLLIALVVIANDERTGGTSGTFDQAGVEELARLQERDGVPALFPDPVGGRQPIFVWHEGADLDEGWIAYDAQVDGAPLALDRDDEVLRAEDGTEYPFTGEGLPQYETDVVDGRLSIELVEDDADQ